MKTPLYRLNRINEARYDRMTLDYRGGKDNSSERERMLEILRKAMSGSLTEQQLICMTEYCKGVPQKQIAAELHLSCSTVCRHIKVAKEKLRLIASYYA